MPKFKLYIATTIDGFIAREDGSLDWLPGAEPGSEVPEDFPETDGGYGEFYSTIDVIVLGKKTYDEVMGFGVDWPYPDAKAFVVTTDTNFKPQTDNTEAIHKLDNESIQKLQQTSNQNIWVIGGGNIISQFLNLDAIDEMILSQFPVILGKGIPLFPNGPKETKFKLTKTEAFGSAFVNLTYQKL